MPSRPMCRAEPNWLSLRPTPRADTDHLWSLRLAPLRRRPLRPRLPVHRTLGCRAGFLARADQGQVCRAGGVSQRSLRYQHVPEHIRWPTIQFQSDDLRQAVCRPLRRAAASIMIDTSRRALPSELTHSAMLPEVLMTATSNTTPKATPTSLVR